MCNRIPLRPLTTPTREYGLFASLRRAIPTPKSREARKNVWLLAATWRIVNKRVSAHQYPVRDQALIWRLGRAINASLRETRRRQMEEADEEVERLLGKDPPLHQEACQRMKGWYRNAVDRTPPPAQVTLERITVEQVDLYHRILPPG